MKQWLKRFIPTAIIDWYHKYLAQIAAWHYRYPARELIVIGVTGTKGKTTTSNLIWHILTQAGYKVGMATTANFRIGERQWLNATKMTMLGRMQLQQIIRTMVDEGCQYAVIETSSEGIKQWRHLGIHYDIVAWTNLYPEHLDAHGGFENYKAAKLSLFTHLSQSPIKVIAGKTQTKAVVLNGDSEHYNDFAQRSEVPTKIVWSRTEKPWANVQINQIQETADGLAWNIGEYHCTSQLHGEWNIDNLASAIGVALTQGLTYPQIVNAVASFAGAPGRMELINQGQPFTVVVDYAYEPVSLSLLYRYWRAHVAATQKILTLISSTGGGRDVARREGNGKVAGQYCDYIIVTDEDPYDDDPQIIIDQVAVGVAAAGKVEGQQFWRIRDRRQAIEHLFTLAQPGDVVILPCKGADQKICRANGKKEPWDDRTVAREILQRLGKTWGKPGEELAQH